VYKDELSNESAAGERKLLYYRHPMGLPDTSPVPKKDEMGMDYIPVYTGETGSGSVTLAPDKVQKLGVTVTPATMRPLERSVRAVGMIAPDESKLFSIAPRFEAWIERLIVKETGRVVRRGEPLFEAYSPELVSAQREYLIAVQSAQYGDADDTILRDLTAGALQRLQNWQIAPAELAQLAKTGKVQRALLFRSPGDGVVLEKMAVEGMRFMPGEMLYKLADLRTVWLIVDVFEQDLASVKLEQKASVSVTAFPGEEFTGRVTFIYPVINEDTRTARIRIELPNDPLRLRPGMFGRVLIDGGDAGRMVIVAPYSAVIDSGVRRVVLVQTGEGVFAPREVITGAHVDDDIEIIAGLAPGEMVVTRGNFLIDAESNLRAALQSFDPGVQKTDAADSMPDAPANIQHQH
jgi:Cu(I)/Ag(I) efflux system membrane fusion protein